MTGVDRQDERFMQLALRLARKGIGAVEPNPAVGCVVVKAGQVIGKGYHRRFGGPHAEVNALEDCRRLGLAPAGGTLYVTLEPCCHWGKTGPCTEAIIQAGIARVVAASVDPSVHATGRGLEQLRQAGIAVETGPCAREAELLNAPFFKHVRTGQPWVILKWAQSLDGQLAYGQPSAARRWITNEASRRDAHRLRRRVGAIVVGINTVLADDPLLTPRPSRGRKPIRVVLDGSLRVPLACNLLRTARTSPVLICTRQAAVDAHPARAEEIRSQGAEVLACEGPAPAVDAAPLAGGIPDFGSQGTNLDAGLLLAELGRRGVQQVLVEGGPRVAGSFLREALVDEICVYIAPKVLGSAGAACISQALMGFGREIGLRHVRIKAFGDDVRIRGLLEKSAPPEEICGHENLR
jgi:diaminohydroxyphosphoribosylaminopyrimidine deaminase/5-amino-6-(5-phosphoribosylamino)uracil reductase